MELSLDLSLSYFPKTIGEFLGEVSGIRDGSQKLSKLDDYVQRLEEEMRKIEAFKRELPLSMLLLKDAVARLKEEAMQCNEINDRALIHKILPLKRNSDEDERVKLGIDASDKKNWMSSVQLWNTNNINSDCQKQDSKSDSKQRSDEGDDRSTCENPIQFCHHRNKGGSFVPFKQLPRFEGSGRKEEKEVVSKVIGLSLMSPISEEGSRNLLPKTNVSKQIRVQSVLQQQQGSKKQRRCWSPELHQRFVDALGRLGGPQVATPKQIREHMQEDGLTNDEVKSHLQVSFSIIVSLCI
uniref:Uncharacterized protein MANES_12G093900 n=1 Tax=Rhizophora mucronata TaxID=61149 RepID=A0A2P2JI18_RHIMU